MSIKFDEVSVGDELPAADITVTRADLIRYAGASGDFNVIHWNERVATSVGLPGVIAHGMYTMALGGRYVSEWARRTARRAASRTGPAVWSSSSRLRLPSHRVDKARAAEKFMIGAPQNALAKARAPRYSCRYEDRFEEHCLVVGTLTRP